jgi:long-chain acyl-CoA synthetase
MYSLLSKEISVREVAVVGAPEPEWINVIAAFVVTQDLDAYCVHEIARFKRPKLDVQVAPMLKNNYDKALKIELRQRLKQSWWYGAAPCTHK